MLRVAARASAAGRIEGRQRVERPTQASPGVRETGRSFGGQLCIERSNEPWHTSPQARQRRRLQCFRMSDAHSTPIDAARPRRRLRKRWLGMAFLLLWAAVGTWHTIKPMPPGTDMSTPAVRVPHEDVRFLYDLTYGDGRGGTVYEQQIFDEVMRIIDDARSFVLVDFFLLNDSMGAADTAPRFLSRELADRLLARKASGPDVEILVITDPINDVYGGNPSPLLAELRAAGIQVAVTDLGRLRDPNPAWSALWRLFVQWWSGADDGATPVGATRGGWLPNPFAPQGPDISLRSWLALLNFKANHRKVVVADTADGELVGLVTSANPHDASSGHSNVAIRFSGELAARVLESELAVARFSGWTGHIHAAAAPPRPVGTALELSFLTEKAIRRHLLAALDATRHGDTARMALFYLSDRGIVDALIAAARRGVEVRLILDPNRDAFGLEKDGVPNRPVANELVTASEGRIAVRWYRTRGEQFHTKMALIVGREQVIATLGSANFTRRNLANYNLEANIAVRAASDAPLAREMLDYFDRLWENRGEPGVEYTVPFAAWRDTSPLRYWRYRLMEATGLSTF